MNIINKKVHLLYFTGPGSYNLQGMGSASIRKAYIESTRQGAFGTTSTRIKPMVKHTDHDQPGPAHYQIQDKPFKSPYQQLSSNFASLTKRLSEPPPIVKVGLFLQNTNRKLPTRFQNVMSSLTLDITLKGQNQGFLTLKYWMMAAIIKKRSNFRIHCIAHWSRLQGSWASYYFLLLNLQPNLYCIANDEVDQNHLVGYWEHLEKNLEKGITWVYKGSCNLRLLYFKNSIYLKQQHQFC